MVKPGLPYLDIVRAVKDKVCKTNNAAWIISLHTDSFVLETTRFSSPVTLWLSTTSRGNLPWCGTELRPEPLTCGLLWWRPWLPSVEQVWSSFSLATASWYRTLIVIVALQCGSSWKKTTSLSLTRWLTVLLCFAAQVLTSSSPITHRSCWAGWRSENRGNAKALTGCHGNRERDRCIMYVIMAGNVLCVRSGSIKHFCHWHDRGKC